ncbi:Fe-S cluster assembly protein HesB [Veronia nyctiphanis]|uniref:Fe-S cluster assembly protein HesB n=1 Tax=Veronia nyctiphanis TaxID=1278244 RepID=A0A4V1LTB7_9GAMM|nr:MurR/RpiR family transcriptional regulator [Veronia nyctiphanis]RXJ74638.1 Fe-S cluster assembly protein HesB [Veronia nyctiphanis]
MSSAATLKELEEQICDRFESLSKRLKQVGRYLLDNPEQVAFETVAVIAQNADVPPSTLIRFARAFGYSGFNEMKVLFRTSLVEGTSDYKERLKIYRELGEDNLDPQTPIDMMRQFARANAEALENMITSISEDNLKNAVDHLNDAGTIYVLAIGRSFNIAAYTFYALRHSGRQAVLIDGLGGMYKEHIDMVSKNDALIAISFAPYAEQTIQCVKLAAKKGCKVISLTDSSVSPLTNISDVSFTVKEASVEGFRSQSSTLCIAQTLAVSLAGYKND